jgi:hypothetical protein
MRNGVREGPIRVTVKDPEFFGIYKVGVGSGARLGDGGRRAAEGCRRGNADGRAQGSEEDRADLMKGRGRVVRSDPRHLRKVPKLIKVAPGLVGLTEGPLGLFHLRAHGVQVVGGGDHREQQHENTTQGAEEDKRSGRRAVRPCPSPPQPIRGQQKAEPTKIEKKLHSHTTKVSRRRARLLDVTRSRKSG